MTIAITCPGQGLAAAEGLSGEARIARVEVLEDMARAEPAWRRLENGSALATAYQRFDLLAAWQQHVGARSGITPFIVIGSDRSEQPLFLWPFGLTRKGPLRIARFLGSKHSNFNLGLWRRDVLPLIGEDDIRSIWRELRTDIDLLVLCNQPLTWHGASNPFLLLPHQASVDMSARLSLRGLPTPIDRILSNSMRSRLRNKERKLAKQRGYRYIQAATAEDIDRLLDSFFTFKAGHMAAQGLGNVFAERGVAKFLRAACHRKLGNGRPLIEIHALEVSAEVVALFGITIDGYRCSSMFNTYTLSNNARYSPGLILLEHLVNECGRRGVQTFDIGVGRAQYKSFFCPEPEPLFDSFVPLTLRGRVAAAGFSAAFAAKRTIKQSRTLWAGVQMMRRARAVTQ
jgi:CelD/BcsL family acetyltransferase involved in cellulose biosynthesis